jgi:hypothetical protein
MLDRMPQMSHPKAGDAEQFTRLSSGIEAPALSSAACGKASSYAFNHALPCVLLRVRWRTHGLKTVCLLRNCVAVTEQRSAAAVLAPDPGDFTALPGKSLIAGHDGLAGLAFQILEDRADVQCRA